MRRRTTSGDEESVNLGLFDFSLPESPKLFFKIAYVILSPRLIKYIAANIPILANKNSNPGGVGVQAGEGEGKSVVIGVVVGV